MNVEVWSILLLSVTTLTSMITEAVKVWLSVHDKSYSANALAGYVSIIVSVAVGVFYAVTNQVAIDAALVCDSVVLAVLSWVSAMIGYDKVIQMLNQLANQKRG